MYSENFIFSEDINNQMNTFDINNNMEDLNLANLALFSGIGKNIYKSSELENNYELMNFCPTKENSELNNFNLKEISENNIYGFRGKSFENSLNDLSSFNDLDILNDSFFNINTNIINVNLEKHEKDIISSEKEESKVEKMSIAKLIGKKRNKEKIDEFKIFTPGNTFQSSRTLIEHILEQEENKENLEEESINSENGKKYIRKDNLRKKIKTRFMKALLKSVNKRLNSAGTKKKFKPLSQKFIANVNREKNREILNISFTKLFLENFFEGKKKVYSDQKKLKHNLLVVKYLEKNHKISEKSNYNSFKDMKFQEIFNEYLKSEELEKEINRLKGIKNVKDEYIKKYVILAFHLIEFFSKKKKQF